MAFTEILGHNLVDPYSGKFVAYEMADESGICGEELCKIEGVAIGLISNDEAVFRPKSRKKKKGEVGYILNPVLSKNSSLRSVGLVNSFVQKHNVKMRCCTRSELNRLHGLFLTGTGRVESIQAGNLITLVSKQLQEQPD